MTTIDRPVRRETYARVQGRPLMIELSRHVVTVRRKGTRLRYTVPIEALWSVGAKIARREADALKAKSKGRKAR